MPKVIKSQELTYPRFMEFFNAHIDKLKIKAIIGGGNSAPLLGYRIYLVEKVPFLFFSREKLTSIGIFEYADDDSPILRLRADHFDRFYQSDIAPICVLYEALRLQVGQMTTVTVVRYELID